MLSLLVMHFSGCSGLFTVEQGVCPQKVNKGLDFMFTSVKFTKISFVWALYFCQCAEALFFSVHYFQDESEQIEVDETLRTILEFWQENPRRDSGQIALVALCLAMLWFLGGDSLKVSHLTNQRSIKASVWHSDTVPYCSLVHLIQRDVSRWD